MVRYYRKGGRRPVRQRTRTYSKSARTTGRKRYAFGNRFKARWQRRKAQGKWQKLTFHSNIGLPLAVSFDNVENVHMGIHNGLRAPYVPGIPADDIQDCTLATRAMWFGAAAAGWNLTNNGVGGNAYGPLKQNFLPGQGVGNGILQLLSQRDEMFGESRWDYGCFQVTHADLANLWNRLNNAGVGPLQATFERVFVKGIKVQINTRDKVRPGLFFMIKRKGAMTQFVETSGSCTAYMKTKKSAAPVIIPTAIGNVPVNWDFNSITFVGPIMSRVKLTAYFKLKNTLNT